MKIQKILVPIDFSENALSALRVAIRLAHTAQSGLVLLNAFTPKIVKGASPESQAEADITEAYHHSQSLRTAYADICTQEGIHPDMEHTKFMTVNSAFVVETISKTVEMSAIDLIVMGTRGASGLKKFFYGSNAMAVIEHAPCDTLLIPQGYLWKGIQKIAFATDLAAPYETLSKVVQFAKFFDAYIDLFHIYPVFPQYVAVEHIDNEAYVQAFAQAHQYDKVRLYFIKTTRDNEVLAGIDTFVKAYKPSMLAMFTKERTMIDRIIDGSMTEEVASHTKIPLLALKKPAQSQGIE